MFQSDFISLSTDSPAKDEYESLTWKLLTRNGSIAGAVSLSETDSISTFLSDGLSEEEATACKYAIADILCEHISRILLLKDIHGSYRSFPGCFGQRDDDLVNIYYLKKYVLIAQNYFNNDSLDFSLEDIEPLNPENRMESISTWCARRVRVIQSIVPDSYIDSFDDDDSGKFPNGKTMNEIPNDHATDIALGNFQCVVNGIFKTRSNDYQLVLHDFADETICFDTKKNADEFIHHFDCWPYTLYKRNGFDSRIEIRATK